MYLYLFVYILWKREISNGESNGGVVQCVHVCAFRVLSEVVAIPAIMWSQWVEADSGQVNSGRGVRHYFYACHLSWGQTGSGQCGTGESDRQGGSS